MLIDIIQDGAEQKFITALEDYNRHSINHGVLHCRFSKIPLKVSAETMLHTVSNALKGMESALYFYRDGDVFITWKGPIRQVLVSLSVALADKFARHFNEHTQTDTIFRFYDSHANGEELRMVCREKLRQFMARAMAEEAKKAAPLVQLHHKIEGAQKTPAQAKPLPPLTLSATQKSMLQRAVAMRANRKEIEILVVEDQDFSRKLLQGALEKHYTCHGAPTAEEAIEIYTLIAPDVCFLDIELNGISGHQLAELFRTHDPEAHIIIVSGNNYPKDVEIAKKNRVQGFIAKPYDKQKIFAMIDRFLEKRTQMEPA